MSNLCCFITKASNQARPGTAAMLTHCYGSNANVPHKPALNPRKVTLPGGGLWEGNRAGASSPHDGLSAPIKRPQRAPLAPPPCGDTTNRQPAPARHQACRRHPLGLPSIRVGEMSVCCAQVPPSVAFCHGGLSGRGRWPQQHRSSGRQP